MDTVIKRREMNENMFARRMDDTGIRELGEGKRRQKTEDRGQRTEDSDPVGMSLEGQSVVISLLSLGVRLGGILNGCMVALMNVHSCLVNYFF